MSASASLPIKTLKINSLRDDQQQLIDGLMDNSPAAFRQLYKMYAANLLGVIMKIVKQQETAEDLLQETFVKISGNIHRYDPSKARLFTWLLNVSRNTAIDHLRKVSSRQDSRTDELETGLIGYEHHFIQSQATDTIGLKKIAGSLPAKQKLMIDMIYFQGYTHLEVSQELDMPLGSVKSALRAAVLNLRKVFGEAASLRKSA